MKKKKSLVPDLSSVPPDVWICEIPKHGNTKHIQCGGQISYKNFSAFDLKIALFPFAK